jgi:hypothetical protein
MAGTCKVVVAYTNSHVLEPAIGPLAFDPLSDLFVGVSTRENPDNLRLYNVENLADSNLQWLDTEFGVPPVNNVNSQGVGQADFGGGRVYALDSNNGLICAGLNLPSAAPLITTQPRTTTNTIGNLVVFGVTSTNGYPLTYQWRHEGVDLANSTNSSLIIPSVQISDGGDYVVVIANPSGSITSSIATLFLAPGITVQPSPPSQVIATNNPFSYGVIAGGTPVLHYHWCLNGSPIANATDSSYSVANALASDSGDYTVVITNSVGSVTSTIATLYVQPGSTPGTGEGLRGDYYNNNYAVNPFAGLPVVSVTNLTIDFDWGVGSPDPLINTDRFSVRWTGQIEPLYSQTYTLSTVSDDGVRLWLNGQKLVDNWTLHGATTNRGTMALVANQKYDVLMEFFENQVSAVARFLWNSPSQPLEAIPTLQLYPAAASVQQPTNFTFSVANKTNLVFNWGAGTFNLVWATNVNGPYTNVIVGVASPYTNIIGKEPAKFFRLQTQ